MTVKKWKVLAIDDDKSNIDDLERILSSGMGGNEFEFTKTTSFDKGLKNISTERFDLVFLDVHEESSDAEPSDNPEAEDQRGENLLQHLQTLRFVPVIFYTGYPFKVKHLESMVVKVVEKGTTIEEVRNAVNSILNTKLPQLSKHIEEQIRSYIWDSLKSVLNNPDLKISPTDIALLMARNLANNLSQNIVKEVLELDTVAINPLEMYQFPPVSNSCSPADIYIEKETDQLWMVFTPACDFEQDKAENVLLAKITPLSECEYYKNWVVLNKKYEDKLNSDNPNKEEIDESKQASNEVRGYVKNIVKNKAGERYKYLPGTFFLPDCIVDFQELKNYPKNESDKFEVICSMDNPYREEMLHLFSKYYGRIGTPDYSFDSIWESIEEELGRT